MSFRGDLEFDERSGEYYLHLFSGKQPDLNWRNPKVMEEIKNVMRFWLDRGIAGFRCDVINLLYKTSLENGRIRPALVLPGSEHYVSQEGTHEILRTLRREVLDHYDCFTVGETVFVTTEDAKLLCDESRRELDMVFSFEHGNRCICKMVQEKIQCRPLRAGNFKVAECPEVECQLSREPRPAPQRFTIWRRRPLPRTIRQDARHPFAYPARDAFYITGPGNRDDQLRFHRMEQIRDVNPTIF